MGFNFERNFTIILFIKNNNQANNSHKSLTLLRKRFDEVRENIKRREREINSMRVKKYFFILFFN